MDYRQRKYYLIHCVDTYNERIDELKSLIPSLKIHPPYNHFRKNHNIEFLNFMRRKNGYDVPNNRDIHDTEAGYGYYSNMISCKMEESELLVEICNKYRYYPLVLKELTKEICNQ